MFSFLITNLFPNTIVEFIPKKLGSLKRTKRDKTLKVTFQTFNKNGKIHGIYTLYMCKFKRNTFIFLFVTQHINEFFISLVITIFSSSQCATKLIYSIEIDPSSFLDMFSVF